MSARTSGGPAIGAELRPRIDQRERQDREHDEGDRKEFRDRDEQPLQDVAVDDVPVWVIPCISVRSQVRGQGVAYAGARGAPAVEAYPRADGKRVHEQWAFYGTEALFRKAGSKKVRRLLPVPKG